MRCAGKHRFPFFPFFVGQGSNAPLHVGFHVVSEGEAWIAFDLLGLLTEGVKGGVGRLRQLRSRIFKDLAVEKLKADDSFENFQNQLALCLDDVRRCEER